MKLLDGKKLPFLIILFSTLMIFFGIVTKYYNGARYSRSIYKKPPLELYDVNLFGLEVPYTYFLLFFVITLGIGIYLFAFKTKNRNLMNEIEILKELIDKKRIVNDLKISIDIWHNNEEKIQFAKDLEKTSAEIDTLEKQLTEIDDKSHSRKAKDSVIYQLEQYITEINKVSPHLNLSRNQGLMLENELFAGIVQDVNYLITDKVFGIHIPAYLKYTVVPEDSVSISELTEFLRNEITILRRINDIDYLKLWEYKDSLIERIRQQFID